MQALNREDLHELRAATKTLLLWLEFNSESGAMNYTQIETAAGKVRAEINALAAVKRDRLAVWNKAAA